MRTPETLEKKAVQFLNARITDEYSAFYFYRQASNWCENIGYTKAAAYFKTEAEGELSHAEMLQKYMTDWNVITTLNTPNMPPDFKGLVELIEAAYELEYALYEDYEDNSNELLKMGDTCTFDFLQKFRTIQREAVAEYATLLNKLKLIDYTDKNWLTRFEQEVF